MSKPVFAAGLEGVIAGRTSIASVRQDGLSYRGYPLEDLAANCRFEEVAHLLLYGELPTSAQLSQFKDILVSFRSLPGEVLNALRRVPTNVSAADVLRTGVSMAGHFEPMEGDAVDTLRRRAVWLLSVVASIISTRHRLVNRREPLEPRPGLSHAAQLLCQIRGEVPDEQSERVLDLILILCAEHGFDTSTFANRVIASTLSDIVSATVGAIGAAKGPLHGGACERSMALLQQFTTPDEASVWAEETLARQEEIAGFGRLVGESGDPRVAILEPELRRLAERAGMLRRVEIHGAIKDEAAKTETPPRPNFDGLCGLAFWLMDLPLELCTPLFVASRVTGWTAHFIEQVMHDRMYRPNSEYIGPTGRTVTPIEQR